MFCLTKPATILYSIRQRSQNYLTFSTMSEQVMNAPPLASRNNDIKNENRKKNKRNPGKRSDWPKKKKKESGDKSNHSHKDKEVSSHKSPLLTENEVLELEPNGGSFAHPDMQAKFGVTLPTPESLGHTKSKDDKEINEDDEENDKIQKRKVAFLLGFVGTKYSGMQINTGQNTIQAQLELGVYKAGLLLPSNFGFPNKYGFNNSARTDKGVHSCAQVCNMKLLVPGDDLEKARVRINEQLPKDIKVLDVVKVPKSFNARTQRCKVQYQYMLPTFTLCNPGKLRGIFDSIIGSNECLYRKGRSDSLSVNDINLIRDKLRNYRSSEESLSKLKNALKCFEGTHYFHNYTSKMASGDASSQRYILSFNVKDCVIDRYGTEWVRTLVVGQSFLLHQIRKMISMAMDVARDKATPDIQEQSFSERYMNINVAPAQGLFLDMSFYDRFNNRLNASDPLDWHTNDQSEPVQRWKDFKENVIQPHIMDEEEYQGNFISYLFNHEYHIECAGFRSTIEKLTSSIEDDTDELK